MFVTQPPTTQLIVGGFGAYLRVINENGIRMQDIVNAMKLEPDFWVDNAPLLLVTPGTVDAKSHLLGHEWYILGPPDRQENAGFYIGRSTKVDAGTQEEAEQQKIKDRAKKRPKQLLNKFRHIGR